MPEPAPSDIERIARSAGISRDVFANQYTPGAREVVVLVQDEARALMHEYIGAEHLLLALLRQEEGIAAHVLESLDITAERVRAQVVRIVGSGEEVPSGRIPFTPRAKRILELALREALSLGHNYIGTEHILLGVVRENEGVASRILLDFGADSEKIRDEVIRSLSSHAPTQVAKLASLPSSPGGSASDEYPADEAPPSSADAPADDSHLLSAPVTALEAVPTHADRPATEDDLGRVRLAEVLAERMRRVRGEDTETVPITGADRRAKLKRDRRAAQSTGSFMVHIHAPWGAGKSSLLNFLAAELRNGDADPQLSQWVVAEFSAWEHQRLEPPWWWLLAAVHRSAGRELWRIDRGRWLWFWLRDLAWHMWNARAAVLSILLAGAVLLAAWGLDWFGLKGSSLTALKTTAVSVTALIAFGTLIWGRIRGTSKRLAFGSAGGAVKFLKRASDPLGVYRRRFGWLVRSAGRPIAVIIDDLDRCKPDYVVALLEGIQTLFADQPVMFVVAADRTWLCQSFAKAYEDFGEVIGEPGRPLGFLFLEKTFQVSMEIPPMSFEDRRKYWGSLTRPPDAAAVSPPGGEVADDAFANVSTQKQVEERISSLLQGGSNAEDVLRAAVRKLNAPALQAQLEDLLREFAPLLENNPRSMKRLVNAYGIERDRLLRERKLPSQEERKKLVLFTILRLRWPRFAEHLLSHPEDAALFGDDGATPPEGHPYVTLFADRDVRLLFDQKLVDVRLDEGVFHRYAGREIEPQPSVGA